jgi:hypothetical protein
VQGWGTSSTDPGACHLLQQLPSTEEHDKNEQWESCPPGGQQCGHEQSHLLGGQHSNYTEVLEDTMGKGMGGGHCRTPGLEGSGSVIWGIWYHCGKTSSLLLKSYFLIHNSPNIKFSILKSSIQWCLRTFQRLCKHHPYLICNIFIIPRRNFSVLCHSSKFPPLSDPRQQVASVFDFSGHFI